MREQFEASSSQPPRARSLAVIADDGDPGRLASLPTVAKSRTPRDPLVGERLKSLLRVVRTRKRALVLSHDNPDPDSLASALGLARIIEDIGGVPCDVGYGGIVGRAENRALVKTLKLPFLHISKLDLRDYDFVALVDTQPECGNHALSDEGSVDAVIDHHPARETSFASAFADVGGEYGATSSIVTSYVRAAGIVPDGALATALFYGIKSDTRDLGREFSGVDVDNYHWLFPLVDHEALSRIEHPRLPPTYFAAMHRALAKARQHGETVVSDLGDVYTADIVAEVADRLLALEDMRWSMALGVFEGHLHVSVRTTDRRVNAGKLVREIIQGLGGSAGGHNSMAGGRIPIEDGDVTIGKGLKSKVLRAFLKGTGAPSRGRTLVPRTP